MRALHAVVILTVLSGCESTPDVTPDGAGTKDAAVVPDAADLDVQRGDLTPADVVVGGDLAVGDLAPADVVVGGDLPVGDLAPADLAAGDAGFTGNRSLSPCSELISPCKGMVAGCILDDKHYIEGSFPGSRKFMVTAAAGKKIRVLILLLNKLSPGSWTEVSWYEPGCTDEYKHSVKNLFSAAGADSVFEAEHGVVKNGDHLVTVFSDAVVKYLLRVEVF